MFLKIKRRTKQSMSKFLPISILILLFSACASKRLPTDTHAKEIPEFAVNTVFLDTSAAVSYRAKIEIAKEQLSGTLVIRTYDADLRRFALLSDVGQTLIDISIFKEYYVLNSIIPAMDKKVVIKEMANLFRTMTQPYVSTKEILNPTQDQRMYEVKRGSNRIIYSYSTIDLKQIAYYGKRKQRFNITLDSSENHYPSNIVLLHKRFPLRISLKLQNDNL